MEIVTPAPTLMKFAHTSPPVQGRFWCRFDPTPLLCLGGPKTLNAEGHIFENCLQNKRCTVGCKLTRAAPDN